jgi:hypothetical protein
LKVALRFACLIFPFLILVFGGSAANVGFTDRFELIFTVQAPVPEQPPPDEPVKVEAAAGLAVRVIAVPALKLAEHVNPQLIPAGELVTVPTPGTRLGDGEGVGRLDYPPVPLSGT